MSTFELTLDAKISNAISMAIGSEDIKDIALFIEEAALDRAEYILGLEELHQSESSRGETP